AAFRARALRSFADIEALSFLMLLPPVARPPSRPRVTAAGFFFFPIPRKYPDLSTLRDTHHARSSERMILCAPTAASILTETISHNTHQEHEEDVCIMSSGTIHKRTWVHDGRTHTAYQFSIAVNGKQVRRQFATKR